MHEKERMRRIMDKEFKDFHYRWSTILIESSSMQADYTLNNLRKNYGLRARKVPIKRLNRIVAYKIQILE